MNKIKITGVIEFDLDGLVVQHQFSDTDQAYRHRVVIPGMAENTNWHNYGQIAFAKTKVYHICATTDSWRSIFPQVFSLTAGFNPRAVSLERKRA